MWLQTVEGWLTTNSSKDCMCSYKQWKDGLLPTVLRIVCVVTDSGRMAYYQQF